MNRWKYVLVGLLVGAFAFPLVWNSDPLVIGQTVTVDSTQSPLVVNALADLADLTPTDGQSVIIKTGTEKGLWYYDKDSATATGVSVLNGPGSVGRFLVINNDAGSVAAATAITAAEITDDSLLELQAFDGSSAKSLTLEELKKTGVQVYNVMQYGATGDGVTDDTAGIQATIDAAQSTGGHCTVYIPAGEYVVTSTLYIRGNNTDSLPNEFIQSPTIMGDGPQSTFIMGDVSDMPAAWFVGAANARFKNLWIANADGDAFRFTASHRSYIENIHSGRGTSDVCCWNDGSQQLRIKDCMFSANIVYQGDATRAKYGIVATSYALRGTATPGSTGLSGLTLTVALTASSTVTVTGNTIQDVANAVNGASTTTGVIASVDGDDRLILSSRTFSATTGVNDNASLVLTNGTGTWAAAGHVAATNTYGTGELATNAMVVRDTTCEQLGFAGAIVHTPKFSVYDRGDAYFSGCTMQGNGYTAGPTYVGDLILDRCIGAKVTQCHLETDTGVSLQLNAAHNTSCSQSYMYDLDIDATQNSSFFANTITGGSIDSTSELTLMIANELYLTGGSFNKFNDECDSTRWIAGNGTNASSNSDGFAAYSVSNLMSEILSYNGKFEYWNGTTHPIGWAAENGATIARSTTAISGAYSVQVTAGAGQTMSGLGFTFPNALVGRNAPTGSTSYRRISVTITAKRTTDSGLPGVALDAGANQYLIPTDADKSFPKDVWVTRRFQGYLSNASAGDIKVIVTPSNTGDATASMLVDDVVITAGLSVPDQYAPAAGENEERLFLSGHYVDYGAAAPVSGYYPAGSIRYNTAPAAGGRLGWVCVTAGSPGTWEDFAPVAGIKATVEANTAGSGTPNALVTNESSKVLTNEGTTAANYHTLPTAVAGLTYTFVVQDADGLRITAASGDTIRLGPNVTATAGYIESTTIGDVVTATAINATEWVGHAYGTWTNGTWSYAVADTP